ncbi:MAG TPA: hypothetical protein VIV57_00635 [Anaeromyxobacter sp.]
MAFRRVERRRRAAERYIARHADELWQAELAARAKEAERREARRPYCGVLECVIERQALELLSADGFEVTKVGRHGWPDQVVVVGDRTLWLEFKKIDGGHITPAQRRVIPRLRKAGAVVLVRPTPEEALEAARRMRAE